MIDQCLPIGSTPHSQAKRDAWQLYTDVTVLSESP